MSIPTAKSYLHYYVLIVSVLICVCICGYILCIFVLECSRIIPQYIVSYPVELFCPSMGIMGRASKENYSSNFACILTEMWTGSSLSENIIQAITYTPNWVKPLTSDLMGMGGGIGLKPMKSPG